MNITIEKPRPEDAAELTNVIIASKSHWGYPEEWLDLWQEELTITPDAIRSREFFVGSNEKEVVFIYSVRHISENNYELEDCWVAPQYIGQGYGKILFEHLKTTLKSLHCSKLRIVSDPHAEGFYRKMGAIRIGEQPSRITDRVLPVLEYEMDQDHEGQVRS
jgi:GNAT superfamily N-acetyltransferase